MKTKLREIKNFLTKYEYQTLLVMSFLSAIPHTIWFINMWSNLPLGEIKIFGDTQAWKTKEVTFSTLNIFCIGFLFFVACKFCVFTFYFLCKTLSQLGKGTVNYFNRRKKDA